jgi:hypothetical protein
MLAGHGLEDAAQQDDLLRLTLLQKELVFPPGSRFGYSNYWFLRTVARENDRLYYVRGAHNRTELLALSETEFVLSGSGIRLTFSELKDGEYTLMSFDSQSDQPSRTERIEPFRPDDGELQGYEGSYYAAELEALHRIQRVKNDLFDLVVCHKSAGRNLHAGIGLQVRAGG